jgi:hypothetical protein
MPSVLVEPRRRTNDNSNLQLLYTVSDRHKRARAPDKPIHFETAHGVLERDHVRLVIPRLDLKRNHGLSDSFGFGRLFGSVRCETFLPEFLSRSTFFFVVGCKEVNFLFFFFCSGGGCMERETIRAGLLRPFVDQERDVPPPRNAFPPSDEPGRDPNSASYDLMWLYHLSALVDVGGEVMAL